MRPVMVIRGGRDSDTAMEAPEPAAEDRTVLAHLLPNGIGRAHGGVQRQKGSFGPLPDSLV